MKNLVYNLYSASSQWFILRVLIQLASFYVTCTYVETLYRVGSRLCVGTCVC